MCKLSINPKPTSPIHSIQNLHDLEILSTYRLSFNSDTRPKGFYKPNFYTKLDSHIPPLLRYLLLIQKSFLHVSLFSHFFGISYCYDINLLLWYETCFLRLLTELFNSLCQFYYSLLCQWWTCYVSNPHNWEECQLLVSYWKLKDFRIDDYQITTSLRNDDFICQLVVYKTYNIHALLLSDVIYYYQMLFHLFLQFF